MNTKSGKAQETNETKSFQFAFTSSFKLDLQVGCRELAQRLVVQSRGQCLAGGVQGGAVPGSGLSRREGTWEAAV